jgi:2-hydroxy-3-oxopropionate reductase
MAGQGSNASTEASGASGDGTLEPIGFIGLGIMGRPMALNLLRAGFQLAVHSRSPGPVDELVAAGAVRGEAPDEVASSAGVVITILPDTPDVEEVLFGERGVEGAARPGTLVIDMSTIDPMATREFAKRLAGGGATMLDAPVSGGERGAIDGTLSIMVGGTDEAFERAQPIFRVLGANIVHVGPSGAGQITKACNQLVVGSNIQAAAEALTMAKAAGVDASKVRQALLGGYAGSKVLEVHGQRILDGDFKPGFRARLHLKDARIVLATAGAVGVPMPGFEPVAQALERLVESGGGELDDSALATLLDPEWAKPGANPVEE